MKKLKLLILTILFTQIAVFAQGDVEELSWPREFEKKNNTITIYQPQVESFKDNILEGRMAISIKPEEKEMIFCAAWFKATLSTDLDERIVSLEKMEIPKIHFPDIDDQKKIDEFSKLLASEIESWDLEMSLDRLTASLGDVEDLKNQSLSLKNDPPDIYFRSVPSSLISIDGEPKLKEIEDSGLEYVVNTAFFIVREKGESTYYIKGGKFWYQSEKITSDWKPTEKVPSHILKLAEDNMEDTVPDSISASITVPPALIVVTKPSEIIATDGDPDYASIENTTLLYVKNSESDIIMDVNSQQHYVLLAGRWYSSVSLKDGDWKFSEPSDLPKEFSEIPDSSAMADVRASVPGTPEAQDVLLEQNIPQTAAVDRATTKVEVKYDGDPHFTLVEGTDVYYAENTDKQVLRIKNRYYCVDDGIWFASDNATGPWVVSDTRPGEVDELPPSSEVYNVKYVYVYDSTPEVVYVGYYPGYTYSYVYGGVVVYGSGYYYNPWYGPYYYPRPVTWGYGVHYSPYTGWGFHVGFSYGWVRWGFHPYHRGYWGARGYHHGARAGYRAGYRAGQRNSNRPGHHSNSRNVYNNRSGNGVKSNDVKRNKAGNNSGNRAKPSTKQNNMYADRSGNVHQRNNDGSWSQKSNKATTSKTQSVARQPQTKPGNSSVNRSSSQQQLNKSAQNRNRGSSNYNRTRSSSSMSGRSGGGRRR